MRCVGAAALLTDHWNVLPENRTGYVEGKKKKKSRDWKHQICWCLFPKTIPYEEICATGQIFSSLGQCNFTDMKAKTCCQTRGRWPCFSNGTEKYHVYTSYTLEFSESLIISHNFVSSETHNYTWENAASAFLPSVKIYKIKETHIRKLLVSAASYVCCQAAVSSQSSVCRLAFLCIPKSLFLLHLPHTCHLSHFGHA